MVIASTIAERQSTEPTDRSMPPEMMTTVMPSAMMPTKAKLRVTLKRFCGVAKVSVSDGERQAGEHRRDEDPERLLADDPAQPAYGSAALSRLRCRCAM